MKITSNNKDKEVVPQVVIMDLNPEKFEKPKDQIFFDFFSMYAKSFIKKGDA
jgi:hypothetical protein